MPQDIEKLQYQRSILSVQAGVTLARHNVVQTGDIEALNSISERIIASAIQVHSALGPGLLESVYRACMTYELRERGLPVASEMLIPIQYKQLVLEGAYRIDLLVANAVIVEAKSVETVLPVHYSQLLSYLKLMDKRVGLLINFNVPRVVLGVKRIVTNF